jgi:hypothetical protein
MLLSVCLGSLKTIFLLVGDFPEGVGKIGVIGSINLFFGDNHFLFFIGEFDFVLCLARS